MKYRCVDCGFPFDTNKCESDKGYHVDNCIMCGGKMMRLDGGSSINPTDIVEGLM